MVIKYSIPSAKTLLLVLLTIGTEGQEPLTHHLNFSYDPNDQFGPRNWHNVDVTGNEWELLDFPVDVSGNECASKRRPSPINLIQPTGECYDDHEILTRLVRDTDCKKEDTWWSITPHSLRFDFPKDRSGCRRPDIDVSGGYKGNWYLLHTEIHIRSEHVIEGRRFDGEIIFYHGDNNDIPYYTMILSVMLDASMPVKDDPILQEWLDEWQAIYDHNEKVCSNGGNISGAGEKIINDDGSESALNYRKPPQTRVRDGSYFEQLARHEAAALAKDPQYYGYDPKNPGATEDFKDSDYDASGRRLAEEKICPKMWPYNIWPSIWYYGYAGQLPYPPCSEIAFYRIFDEPLKISRSQFKQIAKLITSYRDPNSCEIATKASPKGETFRPLAEMNPKHQISFRCKSDKYKHKKFSTCIAKD